MSPFLFSFSSLFFFLFFFFLSFFGKVHARIYTLYIGLRKDARPPRPAHESRMGLLSAVRDPGERSSQNEIKGRSSVCPSKACFKVSYNALSAPMKKMKSIYVCSWKDRSILTVCRSDLPFPLISDIRSDVYTFIILPIDLNRMSDWLAFPFNFSHQTWSVHVYYTAESRCDRCSKINWPFCAGKWTCTSLNTRATNCGYNKT